MTQKEWDECSRGETMLTEIADCSGDTGSEARRRLVLCACNIASLARRHVGNPDRAAFDRCIKTARSWAMGRGSTLGDISDAANAVRNQCYVPAAAAYTALYADTAHASAGCSAEDAAHYTVLYTMRAREPRGFRDELETLAKAADIVRRHYPHPPRGVGR